MNPSPLYVAFHIAVNAGPQDVATLIDNINKFFGREDNAGIAPTTVAAAQNVAPAGAVATALQNASAALDGIVQSHAANTAVERDAANMPWDERIHSSSREKNKDGTWRAKRNVDAALKSRVEAELHAVANPVSMPTNVGAPALIPAATAPAPSLPMPGAAAPSLPPIPGAPAVDPRYTNFVQFIAANTHSESNPTGRITPDWLKTCLLHYQVPNGDMQNLAHNPDMIPTIEAGIKQVLGVA